jgi:hypothetical protein
MTNPLTLSISRVTPTRIQRRRVSEIPRFQSRLHRYGIRRSVTYPRKIETKFIPKVWTDLTAWINCWKKRSRVRMLVGKKEWSLNLQGRHSLSVTWLRRAYHGYPGSRSDPRLATLGQWAGLRTQAAGNWRYRCSIRPRTCRSAMGWTAFSLGGRSGTQILFSAAINTM